MITYQIWEDRDTEGSGGITLIVKSDYSQHEYHLGSCPVMVLEFDAGSWDEAMNIQRQYYGWD